ncbi:hypothetical protein [Cellulosimicrobium marinum]|uniref:hypothetical protein n=1 Tax=Cellulosimicrobium marinum TaxID=1638992 RepID=UPI001E2E8C79|nr:hypothetical protein [Cellulosimicrobium marinum]MCB7135880.1 hypothetical protein [Cellulosimicrobium marinum]
MLRTDLDLVLPGATASQVRALADAPPGTLPDGVRVRVRDDLLVARRWVHGTYATGHSVLRARLGEEPDGVRVRGTVGPSGLDLGLVVIWFVAAAALATLGVTAEEPVALLVALVPLVLGVLYASWLPRSVRDGHDVLSRSLLGAVGRPHGRR